MEHEDNAQFENFLQNSQNRMENLHVGSTGVAVVNTNELGPGLEADVVVDSGNNVVVGQKCDGGEHDDDDEEWKYIKEVQQSEKQQQPQLQERFVIGGENDDEDGFVVGNTTNNNKADGNGHHHHHHDDDMNIGLGDVVGFVVGNGGNGSAGDHHDDEEKLFLKSQQTSAAAATHGNGDFRGYAAFNLDEEDVEIINSLASNTDTNTGSTDEILLGDIGTRPADLDDDGLRNFLNPNNGGYNAADILRQEQLLKQMQRHNICDDDDEASSVATTYGTSSLSENQTPFDQEPLELNNPDASPLVINNPDQQQSDGNFETFDNENKENDDPSNIENHRPTSFQSDLHSELNPNATEFVPSFGSQPTSPTTTEALDGQQQQQQGYIFGDGTPRPAANDVARRLLGVIGDDDLVAESPRKGLGENMDAISLPEEIEFEHEADQRPHGVEQDDNLFGGQQQQELDQQHQQIQLENGQNNLHLHEELAIAGNDSIDFQQRQSPGSSFIDHGPETSVDLELNAGAPGEDDVMNKSMYGEQLIGDNDTNNTNADLTGSDIVGGLSTTPIADILNSVQMLPQEEEDDSHNNSLDEQQQQQQEQPSLPEEENHQQQHNVHDDEVLSAGQHIVAAGSKELLNVEEKELVSHSPSTEELQLNLKNEMHSSHKDIPQLPIDAMMGNANNMQESFYFGHTSSANADIATAPPAADIQLEQSAIDESSLLFDTSVPQEEANTSSLLLNESSDDNVEHQIHEQIVFSAPAPHDLGIVPEIAAVVDITPSPLSTAEEKHLIEATKEEEHENEHRRQHDDEQLEQSEHELEQQMDALLLSGDVGASSQESTEQAAELFTATNVNNIQNAGANPFAIGGEHSKYEFAQPSAAEQAFEGQILLEEAQEEEQKRHDFEQHQQQQYEQHEYNETPLEAAAPPAPAEPESNVNIELAPEPEAIVVAIEETEVVAAAPIESAPPAVENKQQQQDDATPEIAVAAATAVAAAAVAASAAIVAVTPAKPIPTKTPSSDSVKKAKAPATTSAPRVKVAGSSTLGARKSVEASKKPLTTSAPAAKPIAAARPRTAPSTATSKVGSTRKTLTSSSTTAGAPKVPPPRPARPATAPATGLGAKPAGATNRTLVASRLTTTTTAAARKPASTSATNGVSSSVGAPTAASKARTAAATGGAAAKPTTIGVTSNTGSGAAGAAKLKLSPRSTLTSQLRKAAPPASATSGSRSPIKSSATSAGNKSTTVSSTTTAASRAKGGAATSLTTTTTTTTKTFTARPAPKTTHTNNTLTITRRPFSGGTTTSSTTTTTTTARRVSPLKTSTLANKSPAKGPVKSTTPLKTQAKEPIAKASPNSSLLKGGGGGVKKTAVSSPKVGAGAAAAATNGQATKAEQQQQPAEQQQQPAEQQQQDPLFPLNGNGLPEPTSPGAAQPDSSAAAALLDF